VGGDLTFKEGIIVLTYPKAQSPHLPPPLVDTLDKKIFFVTSYLNEYQGH